MEAAVAYLEASLAQKATDRIAADTTLQQNIDDAVPQNLRDLANYVSVEAVMINDLAGLHAIFTGAQFHIRNGSGGHSALFWRIDRMGSAT